jgi:hypothetical protein
MTSESKILTVSYGTFSCTLEGFDDPFNTMKAIAEYFRDLTAEDRYFGAEPPQPDAAMLHRIAEREVSRLVDARVRENGVHLRPQEGAEATPTPATPMPAAEVAPAPVPVEPSLQETIPEGVAAKLARARHAVTLDPAGLAPVALNDLASDLVDEVPTAPVSSFDDLAEDDISSDALTQLEALLRAPVEEEAPAAPEVAVEDAAEALVEAVAGADDNEDWTDAPEAVADLLPEAAQDLALDGDEAPAIAEADALDLDPALDANLLDEAAFEDTLDDAPQPDVTFADLQPEDSFDLPASLTEALRDDPLPEAYDAPAEDSDAAAAVADAAAEPTIADPVAEPVVEAVIEPLDAPAALAPADTDRPAGRGKRVNSRVVRLRPDTADEAKADRPTSRRLTQGNDDAELNRLMRQADDELADDDNRRRLESIAHLKAAVAATEAERALSGDAKPPVDTRSDSYRDDLANVVQPDDAAPEAPSPSADAAKAPAEDTGIKPRRKTVSVRPTEPRPGTIRPGMMGPPPLVLVSEQRIDRFAAFQAPAPAEAPVAPAAPEAKPAPIPDAAKAMPEFAAPATPREGQPAVGLRTGRLTGAIGLGAASPLAPQKKIVLDQPSQSAAADLDDEDDNDESLTATEQAGLAEFAERVGVKSMAEMLEAAAAYATCIEKRSQFTRPQLMRRLMASAGSRQVSREDGLRSFGTLLRTGRIEKVSRGHYMLAETSPYLAEARRFS